MGCWCTPSLSTFTDYAEPAPKNHSTALSINNHAAAELYNCKLSKSKALGFAVTTAVSAKFEPVDSPTQAPTAASSCCQGIRLCCHSCGGLRRTVGWIQLQGHKSTASVEPTKFQKCSRGNLWGKLWRRKMDI